MSGNPPTQPSGNTIAQRAQLAVAELRKSNRYVGPKVRIVRVRGWTAYRAVGGSKERGEGKQRAIRRAEAKKRVRVKGETGGRNSQDGVQLGGEQAQANGEAREEGRKSTEGRDSTRSLVPEMGVRDALPRLAGSSQEGEEGDVSSMA